MKAIVYKKYGSPDVLEMREVAKPVPKDNEVLIKIHATTVSSGDWRARSLELPPGFGLLGRLVFGVFGPRKQILGTELAGEVEAIGKKVTLFNAGDQVFAFPGAAFGAHAEYLAMPETGAIAIKPGNLSFEQAAALPFGGTTALEFLIHKGGLQAGQSVLINGASGATGTAAVQIARYFGAEVTGVCSTANLSLVKSIGAHHVIDYTTEDFTKNGKLYDIIIDTAGTASWARSKNSLSATGRLLVVLGGIGDTLRAVFASKSGGKRLIGGVARERAEDLRLLAKLAESGDFTPVIDRSYPFEKMAEAHAHVDTGHKKGNVVVTLD